MLQLLYSFLEKSQCLSYAFIILSLNAFSQYYWHALKLLFICKQDNHLFLSKTKHVSLYKRVFCAYIKPLLIKQFAGEKASNQPWAGKERFG